MHIVLLSGGSGKRLWPLSNDIRSKQFIPFFRQSDGARQSMAQRVCGQVRRAIPVHRSRLRRRKRRSRLCAASSAIESISVLNLVAAIRFLRLHSSAPTCMM